MGTPNLKRMIWTTLFLNLLSCFLLVYKMAVGIMLSVILTTCPDYVSLCQTSMYGAGGRLLCMSSSSRGRRHVWWNFKVYLILGLISEKRIQFGHFSRKRNTRKHEDIIWSVYVDNAAGCHQWRSCIR